MDLDCGPCVICSWRLDDAEAMVRHADNRKVWLQLRDRFPHPYSMADAKWFLRSVLETKPGTDFAMASILFDLDGTLTDAIVGIERCILHAVRSVGGEVSSGTDLTKYIGPPLRETLSQLLNNPGEELVEKALRRYRERFEATGMYENEVYPGIVELLKRVGAMNWRAYVVTSKPTLYAERIVSHFRLRPFIVRIYGSQMDGKLTRKGELIGHVLREESIPATRAVVIGDRGEDSRGAQANGVDSICVTYGYGGRQELESAGATWICDSAEAVLEVLANRFGRSVEVLG